MKHSRPETEEVALQQCQSLTNIEEMAVLFRMKETEVGPQPGDPQQMIGKLSANEQERKACGVSGHFNTNSALTLAMENQHLCSN